MTFMPTLRWLDDEDARPLVSVRTIEAELGLPYPTAERYIEELVKQGILAGAGKARNRVFRASEIIILIESSKDV